MSNHFQPCIAELSASFTSHTRADGSRYYSLKDPGQGATPATNPVAAVVEGWICEWIAEREKVQAP